MIGTKEAVVMFPTKLLLATDGSTESERAARMAVTISGALDSELHLVHVGHLPSIYGSHESEVLDPNLQDRLRERAQQKARETLEEETKKIENMGGRIASGHAEVGRADAVIVRLAEKMGAGVVILGSRGLGPLRRAVMGSVSRSVVRHAHGPVMVVRGEVRRESYLPGRVLLAVDGSRESRAAEEAAVEISEATGSELHIIFVLKTDLDLPPAHVFASERNRAILQQARRDARDFVDHRAEEIEAKGVRVKDAHLAFGKPDEEIVRFSEELEAGLVVTGSRGLGGVRRALMGSVSDSVVHHAHCPVLVVRERMDLETARSGAQAGSMRR